VGRVGLLEARGHVERLEQEDSLEVLGGHGWSLAAPAWVYLKEK
jgi:hypothetical protein